MRVCWRRLVLRSRCPRNRGGRRGRGDQSAINVVAVYSLLACLAGFLMGGAVWAIGGRVGNEATAVSGKIGMAVCVGVAFLVGAASAILQFAYGLG